MRSISCNHWCFLFIFAAKKESQTTLCDTSPLPSTIRLESKENSGTHVTSSKSAKQSSLSAGNKQNLHQESDKSSDEVKKIDARDNAGRSHASDTKDQGHAKDVAICPDNRKIVASTTSRQDLSLPIIDIKAVSDIKVSHDQIKSNLVKDSKNIPFQEVSDVGVSNTSAVRRRKNLLPSASESDTSVFHRKMKSETSFAPHRSLCSPSFSDPSSPELIVSSDAESPPVSVSSSLSLLMPPTEHLQAPSTPTLSGLLPSNSPPSLMFLAADCLSKRMKAAPRGTPTVYQRHPNRRKKRVVCVDTMPSLMVSHSLIIQLDLHQLAALYYY